jgi:hypothetical protein
MLCSLTDDVILTVALFYEVLYLIMIVKTFYFYHKQYWEVASIWLKGGSEEV